MNTPDPIAVEGLHVAWNTFDVTVIALVLGGIALIVAFIALAVAMADARNNSTQLRMLIEEQQKKPDVQLFWEGGESERSYEVPEDEIFGHVGSIAIPVRALNSGTALATNVTVTFTIPPDARVRSQMPRDVQLRLGQPDWHSVEEMHASGIFAHEHRDVNTDGSRNDDWDIGIVKISAYKDFGQLRVLLAAGRHQFSWETSCNEGVITQGTLDLEVGFGH
jgi:hypothetical protein